MKRVLISIFAVAFVFSAIAFAGEDGCSEAAKKACAAAKTKAGCCAKKSQATSVQTSSIEKSEKPGEADHVCPDVGEKAALQGFHESMHPMHMSVGSKDFDAVRAAMPNLLKASGAVEKYKCEGYDKCTKECRKTFDSRKKALINAVKDLKKACKGKDDDKVMVSFDKMHEAYITFANTCSH